MEVPCLKEMYSHYSMVKPCKSKMNLEELAGYCAMTGSGLLILISDSDNSIGKLKFFYKINKTRSRNKTILNLSPSRKILSIFGPNVEQVS